MVQKLLKRKPRKVAVLVGTYKAGQLAWIKRHGIYNYPVRKNGNA